MLYTETPNNLMTTDVVVTLSSWEPNMVNGVIIDIHIETLA